MICVFVQFGDQVAEQKFPAHDGYTVDAGGYLQVTCSADATATVTINPRFWVSCWLEADTDG